MGHPGGGVLAEVGDAERRWRSGDGQGDGIGKDLAVGRRIGGFQGKSKKV